MNFKKINYYLKLPFYIFLAILLTIFESIANGIMAFVNTWIDNTLETKDAIGDGIAVINKDD